MPSTKVFITGATGYIGGDALYHLAQTHSNLDLSLLVRSESKAKAVREKYPDARIVIGGLDDAGIIRREAAWADIVLHTADSSDHEVSAKAIAEGLIEGHSPDKPGYWLHLGGTGILTYFDSEVKKVFGEPDDKVFNDLDGVEELVNLPSAAFHRNIDEIVLKTGTENASSVKTVIICPPTIYGEGRGPVSGRGRQAYELAAFILNEKYTPHIGRGLARWNNVHIYDLSVAIGLLFDAALDPSRKDDAEIWGPHGYFLIENGEHVWGDLAEAIGRETHKQGFLKEEPQVRGLSYEEAVNTAAGFQAASWGLNSRGSAQRARKVLGWKPVEKSIEEEVPAIVKYEAARLA